MAKTYAVCPNCDRLNRVDTESLRSGKKPICGYCHRDLPMNGGVAEVSGGGLGQILRHSDLPVIADFWSPVCSPCHAFSPVFKQAAQQMAGRAIFVKINVLLHPLASDTYHVRSLPSILVFSSSLERARASGALPLSSFLNWIESVLRAQAAA